MVAAGQSKSVEVIHLPIQIRIALARTLLKSTPPRRPLRLIPAGRPPLASVRDAASAAYLSELLEEVGGDVETACAIAEVSRSRFYGLLKTYGIRSGHGKAPEPEASSRVICEAS